MATKKTKITLTEYPLLQDANGEQTKLRVYDLHSALPGPFAYFQASVHGAEIQGNLVIQKLFNFFKSHPFKGTLRFVPLANPMASRHKMGQYTYGRFNPVTGNNWNRNYLDLFSEKSTAIHGHDLSSFVKKFKKAKLSEIKKNFKLYINQALKAYVKKKFKDILPENGAFNFKLQELAAPADIVLDLHTGPRACRYIYSAYYAKDEALHFSFPHILSIPHEFAGAMDEATFMPWIHLHRELGRKDISLTELFLSYTLEFGSEEVISSEDAEKDMNGILRFLRTRDVYHGPIKGSDWIDESEKIAICELKDYRTYYAPHGGLTEFHLSPSSAYKKGDLMATQYVTSSKKNVIFEEKKIQADCSGIVINHYTSGLVPQGAELFQVMQNYQLFDPPRLYQ